MNTENATLQATPTVFDETDRLHKMQDPGEYAAPTVTSTPMHQVVRGAGAQFEVDAPDFLRPSSG